MPSSGTTEFEWTALYSERDDKGVPVWLFETDVTVSVAWSCDESGLHIDEYESFTVTRDVTKFDIEQDKNVTTLHRIVIREGHFMYDALVRVMDADEDRVREKIEEDIGNALPTYSEAMAEHRLLPSQLI